MTEDISSDVPPRFREVSFTGRSSSIILRSTYDAETIPFLLNTAITAVIQYEDDELKATLIKNMKEVKE